MNSGRLSGLKPQYAAKKLTPVKKGPYFAPRPVDVREDFLCSNEEEVIEKLRKFGIAIMPNILSKEKCERHFHAIIKDCEELVPDFKYKKEKTWADFRRITGAKTGMILQTNGFPWTQGVCNLRGEEEIINFWAKLWSAMDKKHMNADGSKGYKPEHLLSSMDAFALYLNHSGCKYGWEKNRKPNFHVDKSLDEAKEKICCIQSFVNLLPSQKGGACFRAIEKSHGYLEEFSEAFPGSLDDNFNQIKTQEELDWYLSKEGCRVVNVRAEPGDKVLWTSSLVHFGCAATMPAEDEHVAYKRCVAYIAFQPRKYASKRDIAKKVQAWKTRRGTGHRAAKGVSLFPLEARTYGKESQVKKLGVYPILSKLSQSMYGLI
jgi:hypothetical protein